MTIDFSQAREKMVEQQIRPWDVLDLRVLDVLARLPREAFVPQAYQALAYADLEIPLAGGQKMMIWSSGQTLVARRQCSPLASTRCSLRHFW